MHTSLRITLAAAVVLVVGCGKKAVAPAGEKKVTLGGKTATYHDWAKANPCQAEPKMVISDLDSTSALLTEYLAQTSGPWGPTAAASVTDGGADAVTDAGAVAVAVADAGAAVDADGGAAVAVAGWTSEQIALLEEGVVVLPALLDATDKATGAIARNGCRFLKETGFSGPTQKVIELSELARKRIAEAPAIAEGLAAQAALKKWKDSLPGLRTSAKAEWCPPKLKPGAPVDIYFASEDEVGLTQWHFCDDARVFASAGAPPAFEAPATMKKKPKDKPYLDSAAKYPASDVQRAPKGPAPLGMADGGTELGADGGTADAGS